MQAPLKRHSRSIHEALERTAHHRAIAGPQVLARPRLRESRRSVRSLAGAGPHWGCADAVLWEPMLVAR
jgi:hypothetical protein